MQGKALLMTVIFLKDQWKRINKMDFEGAETEIDIVVDVLHTSILSAELKDSLKVPSSVVLSALMETVALYNPFFALCQFMVHH